MMNTRIVASFLLAFSFAPIGVATGQIGGLIRKKVTESVKGDDNKAQPAKADAEAGQQAGSKLGRAVTGATLEAFKTGLTAERDHRQATVKFLASIKTQEQYASCRQSLAAGPEFQKIMMSLGELGDNPTQEQMQKAALKQQADMAKLSNDKCGEDPGKYDESWKSRQLEAAETAGSRAFSAALGTGSGSGPFLAVDGEAQDDLAFYRVLKEWIPPFCRLSAAAQQAAAAKGVSVPGSGRGNFYVYGAEEAKLLVQLCPVLMPLIDGLT